MYYFQMVTDLTKSATDFKKKTQITSESQTFRITNSSINPQPVSTIKET